MKNKNENTRLSEIENDLFLKKVNTVVSAILFSIITLGLLVLSLVLAVNNSPMLTDGVSHTTLTYLVIHALFFAVVYLCGHGLKLYIEKNGEEIDEEQRFLDIVYKMRDRETNDDV